ncbi:MAG TPA: hypothetical protein DCP51_09025 [Clostridiales bacterium]|nr:hypothetical protein [Clostridiales bacterium]
MQIGNTIGRMFKSLFGRQKARVVQKIDMRIANKPEKKNDSEKKRKIGNTRISGWSEHKFSNYHFGTFSPCNHFRVNHRIIT